ncbi:MAG: hypothetical protein J6X60_05265, partial [Ruminiclostridium sp.]|nr:hypothetical protein [Ruminiclostridium sp.]
MKRIFSIFIAVIITFLLSVPSAAIIPQNSIPTSVLNNILSDYRKALKKGESYVSLKQYGISNSKDILSLYEYFMHINGEQASINFGKYSESYVKIFLDDSESGNTLKGVTIEYSERYRKEDGSCDTDRVKKDQELVSDRFRKAKSYVRNSMSDAEKALVLYDFIITASDYAEELTDPGPRFDPYPSEAYTAVGLLCDGSAVCAAYAKLYAILLNESGIEAFTVDSDEMDHEWVMLKIDDKWYHADPTWDDVIYNKGKTCMSDPNNDDRDIGAVSHEYFLKSDEEIRELEHTSWSCSYSVNPKDYSTPPDSGNSNAFDDRFFSDKNDAFNCVTKMNYVNGSWYFSDLNSGGIVRAKYDGDYEIIPLPDKEKAKYCFSYDNDLYINTNSIIYRYDTVSGIFEKIFSIPADSRDNNFYSEIRVFYDELTVITVSTSPSESGSGNDSSSFVTNTYPMQDVSVMKEITDDTSSDNRLTATRDNTLSEPG